MKQNSFNSLNFSEEKVVTKVLLESSFSKEIAIFMRLGQLMKEHKAPFPIIIHILKGEIDFGLNGQIQILEEGDIISLLSNVPHDLAARKDSIIRLTLSKLDKAKRVDEVIVNS